jgi:hypothetical protein
MNALELGLQAVSIIAKLVPPPKRQPVDYSEEKKIYNDYYDRLSQTLGTMPKFGEGYPIAKTTIIQTTEAPAEAPVQYPQLPPPPAGEKKAVATSCIACSRSHLATIAGALDESLRFAREGGVTHPEVIKRLDIAEREVTMMERIDLSPEAILNSPKREQDLARGFLPKIRQLRQNIGQIASVEQLEQAASESSILTHEFRLRQMEMAGANLNPIIALAKAVENGEMTMEEARAKVKEYLPSEG